MPSSVPGLGVKTASTPLAEPRDLQVPASPSPFGRGFSATSSAWGSTVEEADQACLSVGVGGCATMALELWGL